MRPTVRQAQALAEMLRDHRSLNNAALQERRDAYQHSSRTSIRYGDQSAQLKEIRAFDPERQGHWSFSSQQATLRRLDKAFAAFFRRIKNGEKPGYPRFKGVRHFGQRDLPEGRGQLPLGLHPAQCAHPCATSGRRAHPGASAPAR
ncbi:hypothetical protein [Streptomyces sp. RB17]|uniref:hypothetical protein n=1 Tax=Streptomyces sp. RB17 TaxID=2585197 RepID=UPI003A4C636D